MRRQTGGCVLQRCGRRQTAGALVTAGGTPPAWPARDQHQSVSVMTWYADELQRSQQQFTYLSLHCACP